MDPNQFDRVSRIFATHRLSRRRAMQQGAAGLAAVGLATAGLKASAAQDATPAADDPAKTEFLFVQSFEGGTVAPKEGADGTYTLTLQHGLGQTIYFSDRPERIVGANPTPKFLAGLGFSPDNPPNAALVVDTGDGGVDIAVVELTNPNYDEATHTATYDATVLEDYEREAGMQFQEATADLAALAASFGSAHLFIDDCPDGIETCWATGIDANCHRVGDIGFGNCWDWGRWQCLPCGSYRGTCNSTYADKCNNGQCVDDIEMCGATGCVAAGQATCAPVG